MDRLHVKSAKVPEKNLYLIFKPRTLVLGDFEVQWKNLEKNALQVSGLETFSFNSMQTVNFRAVFGYVRDKIQWYA